MKSAKDIINIIVESMNQAEVEYFDKSAIYGRTSENAFAAFVKWSAHGELLAKIIEAYDNSSESIFIKGDRVI